jgi:hypothetical protein
VFPQSALVVVAVVVVVVLWHTAGKVQFLERWAELGQEIRPGSERESVQGLVLRRWPMASGRGHSEEARESTNRVWVSQTQHQLGAGSEMGT